MIDTRDTLPPIHFEITQVIGNNPRFRRRIPNIGLNLSHGGKSLGLARSRYYNGEITWNLNPRTQFFGNLDLPPECEKADMKLTIEVKVMIIDIYKREHDLYPVCFTFNPKKNSWFLEPTSYNELR